MNIMGYPRMKIGDELLIGAYTMFDSKQKPRMISATVLQVWPKYMVVRTEAGIRTTVWIRPAEQIMMEDRVV